ncbi:unnamed protein product [Polarella glacialis]|uniref:Uncharacterized protein n=1 Tax=Polarella glacialis TaxID=89957 RepID=A0A813IXJ9_POLGL|nr:unnamed protein product [Polarella glacialis]
MSEATSFVKKCVALRLVVGSIKDSVVSDPIAHAIKLGHQTEQIQRQLPQTSFRTGTNACIVTDVWNQSHVRHAAKNSQRQLPLAALLNYFCNV